MSWTLEAPHADRISSAVLLANLFSYGLLALVPTWLLIQSRKSLRAAMHGARRIIYDGPTPDGRRMTAYQDGFIRFFDAKTGSPLEVLAPIRPEVVWEAISPDGRLSLGRDKRGHGIWKNATMREVCRLDDDDLFHFVVFSPNFEYLATVGERTGAGRLWSCQAGKLLLSCNGCVSMVFSPDSRMLALSGGDDDSSDTLYVCIWDLETCKLMQTLSGCEGYPDLKFSADGRHLTVEDYERSFIYRTDDWEVRQVLEGKDRKIPDWA